MLCSFHYYSKMFTILKVRLVNSGIYKPIIARRKKYQWTVKVKFILN